MQYTLIMGFFNSLASNFFSFLFNIALFFHFLTGTLGGTSLAAHGPLRRDLQRWLARARHAGLDDESIEALFLNTFRSAAAEGVA